VELNKELKGAELMFTALKMLMGEEGVAFCYYENDTIWWELRLFTRRN